MVHSSTVVVARFFMISNNVGQANLQFLFERNSVWVCVSFWCFGKLCFQKKKTVWTEPSNKIIYFIFYCWLPVVCFQHFWFMRKPGTKVGPHTYGGQLVPGFFPKIDLFVRALIMRRMILCENRAPSSDAWLFNRNGCRCWVRANVPVADQHDNTHKEQ